MRAGRCAALGLFALACTGVLAANDLTLTNALLFDGAGDSARPVSSVVIRGGRIASVNAEAGETAAAGDVVDLGGAFLMPGLVDTHVHLSFDFRGTSMYFPKSDAEYAEYVDTRMREKLGDLLDHGFTTIMSPGDFWPQIIDVRERQRRGELRGPRVLVSGGIFTAPDGHPAVGICSGNMICAAIAPVADVLAAVGLCEGREYCAQHVAVEVDDAEAARARVREYAEGGADQLKITYVEPDGPKLAPEVVRAIIDEAHRNGLRALVHAMDARDVNDLVEWGVDGFVHPPSITADQNGDLLGSAGRKGLAVAATLGTLEVMAEAYGGEPGEEDVREYNLTRDNVKSMMAFGAKPVLGSDLPGFSAEDVLRATFGALENLGLTNAGALRAATRDAAQALLALDDVGTIEAGNVADLIVLRGNPLMDLAAVRDVSMVIQHGAIVVDRR